MFLNLSSFFVLIFAPKLLKKIYLKCLGMKNELFKFYGQKMNFIQILGTKKKNLDFYFNFNFLVSNVEAK
jgi:hypothetical protein